MSHVPPTLIFDMGNVILPFDPLRPCEALTEATGLTPLEIARRIYFTNTERAFEEGRIDGAEFTRRCSQAIGTELKLQEWRPLWSDMFTENIEVSDLIRQLHPHHQLILLSNTNVWHGEYALETYDIIGSFEKRVMSYEVGFMKPHPAIYRAALECVEVEGPVIFIDDMQNNVDGAEIVGIKGIRFESADQLRRDLIKLGCQL